MTFWTAGAIAGSALLGAYSSNKAANTQAAAADQATQLQREMWQKQLELQQPYQQAGVNALNKLSTGDVMGYMDPSYQFRLSEGLKAMQRTAAARGGLLSGGALKEAQRYGQGLASTEYGNAFNRLASLAGVGQTATNQLGSAAGTYGSNVGNLMTSGAASRASGYVGGANALTGGLGQYLNYTQNQNLMNALLNRSVGANSIGYGTQYTGEGPIGYAP